MWDKLFSKKNTYCAVRCGFVQKEIYGWKDKEMLPFLLS